MLDLAVLYEYEESFYDKELIRFISTLYNISEVEFNKLSGDFYSRLQKLDPESKNKENLFAYFDKRIENEKNFIRFKNLVATKYLGISYQEFLYKIKQINDFPLAFKTEELGTIKILESFFLNQNMQSLLESYKNLPNEIYEFFKLVDYKLTKFYHKMFSEYPHIGTASVGHTEGDIEIKNIDTTNYYMIINVLLDDEMWISNNQNALTLTQYIDELMKPAIFGNQFLSASAINQDYIGITSKSRKVIFGYANIPTESIININTGDIVGSSNPKFRINYTPEDFIKKTHYIYNEINFKKLDEKGNKILPSFVLALDRPVDNDRIVASKLGIPIYVINSDSVVMNRKNKTAVMRKNVDSTKDIFEKLEKMTELYKFQEQTAFLSIGAFKGYIDAHIKEREDALLKLSALIDTVSLNLIYTEKGTIQENIYIYEKINRLCWIINDINYTNKVSAREVNYIPSTELIKKEVFEKKENIFKQLDSIFTNKLTIYSDLYGLIELISLKTTTDDLKFIEYIEDYKIKALDLVRDTPNLDIYLLLYSIGITDFDNIKIYEKENEKVMFYNLVPIYFYNGEFHKLSKAISLFSLAKQITEYSTRKDIFRVTYSKKGDCFIHNEEVKVEELPNLKNIVIVDSVNKKEEPEIINFE